MPRGMPEVIATKQKFYRVSNFPNVIGLIDGRFQAGEFGGAHLLGDSGYPLEENLMTPFMQPGNHSEVNYNNSHKRTRMIQTTLIPSIKVFVMYQQAKQNDKRLYRSISETSGYHIF
ncbi:hypothetical protein Pcinc_020538 [Petrolisthes cinctipes]|uniref:DDE Tnp4 domain-containing protein n=1 Tax=Petrolisthes cinctipes TaxID=88211 RepID=A0AAE1FM79_PETCI|nr:hypothetical protein Pcinc_020538 [Petrolisthes cinctipes]